MSQPNIPTASRLESSALNLELSLNVGSGAAETNTLLHATLGSDMSRLPMQSRLPGVFRHGFHVARFNMLVGEVAARKGRMLNNTRRAQLAVGGYLHDIGKTHPTIVPPVEFPGNFDDAQRRAMGEHAPLGSAILLDWEWEAALREDRDRARIYSFAGEVACDHHMYDIPYPATGSAADKWRWEATVITQNTDRVEAMTDPSRVYVPARMKAEGDVSVRASLDRQLQQTYGTAQHDPLPITGVSPREIIELVLVERQLELPPEVVGRMALIGQH